MTAWCRRVAEKESFQSIIIAVIVFNAVVIGLETSRGLMAAYGRLFQVLNMAVQTIFVFEIAVRMLAYSGVAQAGYMLAPLAVAG